MKRKIGTEKTRPPYECRRAVYAFCNEPGQVLFDELNSLFNRFIQDASTPNPISPHPLWKLAGDVYKFGVHITLRGVCPVREDYLGEWISKIRSIINDFSSICLEDSKLSLRFPRGIAITFNGTPEAKMELANLAREISFVTKSFIAWEPITSLEINTAINNLLVSHQNEEIKNKIKILKEIDIMREAGNLPQLPATPEYRLPLLVALWSDPYRDALFEVGDPFAINLEPHISILAGVDKSVRLDSLIADLADEFPQFIGQTVLIDKVYIMVENTQRTVLVKESDPWTGVRYQVKRPMWEIESVLLMKNYQ